MYLGSSVHLTTKRASLFHFLYDSDSLSPVIYYYLIVLPFIHTRDQLCWLLHD